MSNVHNFVSLVSQSNRNIGVLANMASQVRQDVKFTRPQIDSANPIMLAKEFYDQGAPVEFRPKPLLKLGRDRSRHEVHFGSLMLENTDKSLRTNIDIAVKDCQLSSGLGEIAMNQYAMSRGLYAFQPVGIFLLDKIFHGDRLAHIVTRFDKEVFSLDALPWQEMDTDYIKSVIGKAAIAAADFHKNGLFHGDLEFKNLGQRTTGEVVVIDLEHTVGAEDMMAIAALQLGFPQETQDRARKRIEMKSRSDFRAMNKSIGDLRPFTGLSEERKLRVAQQAILGPYIDRIQSSSPNPFADLLTSSAKIAFADFRNGK